MDKNRFWNEFKIVMADNKKMDAGVLGLMFFGPLIMMTLMMSDLFYDSSVALTTRADNVAQIGSIFSMLLTSYVSAMVFGDLNNKSHQIRLMTNPSTMAEKFWARFLHLVLLLMVAASVVFYAAVLLWIVFNLDRVDATLFEHLMGFNVNKVTETLTSSPVFWIFSWVGEISYISVYAVGATYFRKHPFLYTTLVAAGVFLVVMFGIGFCIGMASGIWGAEVINSYIPDVDTVLIAFFIIYTVLSVVMLWWACHRFTKLQFKSR